SKRRRDSRAGALDKMRTRGCRVERIGEILRLAGYLSVAEFHDAHRIGWHAVITENEFRDPEIAAPDHSPDRKALLVRLDEPALLNVAPAVDPFAGLRIVEDSILAVDLVLDIEVVCVRSSPVALQREPHGSIIHVHLHARSSTHMTAVKQS